jgi:hypothetical protein
MMEEFHYYITKMQNLCRDETLQPLLNKRKSRQFVEQIVVNVEKKKEKIDKIKCLIKENKKDHNTKEIAQSILDNYSKAENSNVDVINKEILNQEEIFKKRLEEKRARGNSQPHMKLRVIYFIYY